MKAQNNELDINQTLPLIPSFHSKGQNERIEEYSTNAGETAFSFSSLSAIQVPHPAPCLALEHLIEHPPSRIIRFERDTRAAHINCCTRSGTNFSGTKR